MIPPESPKSNTLAWSAMSVLHTANLLAAWRKDSLHPWKKFLYLLQFALSSSACQKLKSAVLRLCRGLYASVMRQTGLSICRDWRQRLEAKRNEPSFTTISGKVSARGICSHVKELPNIANSHDQSRSRSVRVKRRHLRCTNMSRLKAGMRSLKPCQAYCSETSERKCIVAGLSFCFAQSGMIPFQNAFQVKAHKIL